MPNATPQRFVFTLFAGWCVCLVAGFIWLSADAAIASPNAQAPHKISAADLFTSRDKTQLMVFLHPRCSCSNATLNELERVIASTPQKPDVHFYFADVMPQEELKNSHLWKQAARFTPASLQIDIQQIAQHFGVESSGNILLYSANGDLLFSGGITAARGHEGDNAGKSKLISLLNNETTMFTQPAVFGCALAHPNDAVASRL